MVTPPLVKAKSIPWKPSSSSSSKTIARLAVIVNFELESTLIVENVKLNAELSVEPCKNTSFVLLSVIVLCLIVLLLDPLLSKTPEGFVTQLLLASAAHLRFPIPMFPVLTKCDLLEPEEIDNIREWASDLDTLAMSMPNLDGMSGVLSSELLRVLQVLALESNLIAVSSKEGEGMDDLYSIIQSTFAGGDDLEAHVDTN